MQKSFADLGLSEAALRAVARLGYDAPSPVQAATIPLVLEGHDLIAAASTGTGKTAAFLLPTMDKYSHSKKSGRKPNILVVSPTRELAQQIAHACMQIAKETGQYVTTVFGGSPYGPQIKDLKRGTDILIATPGRLKDLLARGNAKLDGIEVLVLDEADRMLDMGFLPDMKTIIAATPDSRQTLLFSATIDKSITKGIGSMLKDPEVVEIARKGETAKTVKQYIMPIAHKNKFELLRAVLDEKGSERVIVFARTKNRTEECVDMLRENGYSAESIHSDRSQIQRRKALTNFRRGRTDILVATDVLARGIDVPDVDHVINVDLPDCPEDYVHRIGRTGRAGEEGFAISFVTRETRNTLRDIEKLTSEDIPFMQLENYATDPSLLEGKGKSAGRGNAHGKGKGAGRSNAHGKGKGAGRSNAHGTGRSPYRGKSKGAEQSGNRSNGRGSATRSASSNDHGESARSASASSHGAKTRSASSNRGKDGARELVKPGKKRSNGKPSTSPKPHRGSSSTGAPKAKRQRTRTGKSTYDYSRFAK